ncbi:non-homologous end joining protein Ku [Brevibacterium yomogidense]|uniref:non-homologous end joining protein Ku n=1 Tax=Brevibacterium yomogidense TaxID=946573 RepID=UPI0018DFB075|nr:Ku protein [Brevibacterium yomogidense]
MRAIKSGTVAFGLVSVPVKLYSATQSHDVSLHQVHDDDGGRIRYQRRCEVCGKKIDFEHIDKAFDDGEDTVIITDEDLDSLPAGEGSDIEVVQFVPDEQIDPMSFEKSYYLEPDSKSPKAYILLRNVLEQTERTAIVKFAMRSRTRLAALRVRDEVIVLQTIRWADELREADFPSTRSDVKISAREMKMARSLVEQFSEDYEPDRFVDEYQEQLRALIDAKMEHGDVLDTDATFGDVSEDDADGGGDVIDLMEALRRSVDSKRTSARKPAAKKARSTATSSAKKSGSAPKKKPRASSAKKSGEKGSGTKGSGTKSSAKKTEPTKATTKKTRAQGSGTKASTKKTEPTKTSAKKSSGSSKSA